MTGSRAQTEFTVEVVEGTRRLKREIDYIPTRFNQMVGELGAVGAARQLVNSAAVSDGFTTLWEADRLAMSVEAMVLLPWYAELFTDADRAKARTKLSDHRFDVDGFIAERASHPPEWWENCNW
jgi:hypothetical protein